MKKIGLMGCGAVADYGHIPAIQSVKDLELYSVFDPNEETLERVQKKFNIPNAFSSSEDFFKSGIDAVSITSPAPCHKENVLDSARYGFPVLCEKPLAMNQAEGEEMIRAMNQAGVTLYTGFCYRFSPCAIKIRELVNQKAIGDVRSLRLIYNWNCHGKYVKGEDGNKQIQKRREGRMLEGGPMVDCGTHQIDLAMFWLNSDIIHFTGHGAWVDEYEAPDHVWLHMDHDNGAHTVVEMSYSYHHTSLNKRSEFVYELIGTKGVIRYDRGNNSFTLEDEDGLKTLPYSEEKNFPGMYEEWAKSLHTGHSDLLTTAEKGMEVASIAREATNQAMQQHIK